MREHGLNRRGFLALAGAGAAGFGLAKAVTHKRPARQIDGITLPEDTLDVLAKLAAARRVQPLLGCGMPSPSDVPRETYEVLKAKCLPICNAITPNNALKWTYLEPKRGAYDWRDADEMMVWCGERGLRMRMHTSLWGEDEGRPEWSRELSETELRKVVLDFAAAVAKRYRGHFYAWDIINEPINTPYYIEKLPGIGKELVSLVRSIDASAPLVVNEYDAIMYPSHSGGKSCTTALVDYAKSVGADGVGLQAHDDRWYTIEEVKGTLNVFRNAGLQVHLTEITRASRGPKIHIGVREEFDRALGGCAPFGLWDEEMQAAAYMEMYRAAMADENVKSVTVWSLWDGRCWNRRLETGLLREDLSEKPAYRTISDIAKPVLSRA